jgi:hypothetical protein
MGSASAVELKAERFVTAIIIGLHLYPCGV